MQYPINEEQREGLFIAQCGKCAICGLSEVHQPGLTYKRLAVDHDHKTNEVRGLLCSACNLGLGNFRDSQRRLRNAIKYLAKHEQLPTDKEIEKFCQERASHDLTPLDA